jgi:hypothetical protein
MLSSIGMIYLQDFKRVVLRSQEIEVIDVHCSMENVANDSEWRSYVNMIDLDYTGRCERELGVRASFAYAYI